MFFYLLDIAGPGAAGLERFWLFLPFGYLATVAIELPILFFLLPRKLSIRSRAACGFWLTACTYPIVVLVLPALMWGVSRAVYLLAAETFAPAAECLLFWIAFRKHAGLAANDWIRSFIVIIIANLASFGIGEILNSFVWDGWF